MNRRFDYGKIALVLTAVILGIFAVDFFRRLWIDWGNARGKLTIHNTSSSVAEVEPGTALTTTTESWLTTDATGDGTGVSSSTTTSTTAQNVVNPGDAQQKTVQNSEVYEGSMLLIDAQHPLQGTPAMSSFMDFKYEHIRVPMKSLLVNKLQVQSLVGMFKAFHTATSLNNVMVYATTLIPSSPAYAANIPERASGLSLDLAVLNEAAGKHTPFTGEGQYVWFQQHAAEFGYILRYPADKTEQTGMNGITWHYRYVGTPHALYMKEQNLCFEEYMTLVRTHPWEGEHITFSYGGTDYQVYYVPAAQSGTSTQIPYPEGWEAAVSGDNIDGFVVTCSKTAG